MNIINNCYDIIDLLHRKCYGDIKIPLKYVLRIQKECYNEQG